MSCVCTVEHLQANFTACFEVQSFPPSPPFRLFWVVPDVTWAESLSERTFHGNEVRVMVRPGAKRSAWNTKRRTPWQPRPDSTEQSLAPVHWTDFYWNSVCVRKTTCDVSFWVRPHGSHLNLIYCSDMKCVFARGFQACRHWRNWRRYFKPPG